MYYDDYMNDFMYYNSNNPNNLNYMQMNNGFNNMNYMPQNNLENFYPSIFKIIQPVVRRVVAGSNYQYLTEEVLNNMVDTVYNIIDGENSLNSRNSEADNLQNSENRRTSTSNTSQDSSQSRNNQNNNKLLKDLIKIMLLNEIYKNNFRKNNLNMYQNQYMPYNNMFI